MSCGYNLIWYVFVTYIVSETRYNFSEIAITELPNHYPVKLNSIM